jgi:hypothetical protein
MTCTGVYKIETLKVQKEKMKTILCAAAGTTTNQHGSETCTVSPTSDNNKMR